MTIVFNRPHSNCVTVKMLFANTSRGCTMLSAQSTRWDHGGVGGGTEGTLSQSVFPSPAKIKIDPCEG